MELRLVSKQEIIKEENQRHSQQSRSLRHHRKLASKTIKKQTKRASKQSKPSKRESPSKHTSNEHVKKADMDDLQHALRDVLKNEKKIRKMIQQSNLFGSKKLKYI